MRSESACTSLNTLHCVFTSRLGHSAQTHRFRHCSSATAEALEYPKKNSRNGNKEELYFYFIRGIGFLSAAPLAPGSFNVPGDGSSQKSEYRALIYGMIRTRSRVKMYIY